MAEHYSKRLKARISELEKERDSAVEALKQIALGKQEGTMEFAHKELVKLGLTGIEVDPDCPPNTIYTAAFPGLKPKLPMAAYF
jgi:hypothetical protein